MNIDYVLVVILSISRILLVKSRKNRGLTTSESSEVEGGKSVYYYKPFELDLNGAIRRYFAVAAALSDRKNDLVYSPVCAMLPLGKMAYGSVDGTRQEILDATGIGSRDELRPAMLKIINHLQYLRGVTLDVASALFVSNHHTIREEFINKCNDTFSSFIEQVDCGEDAAVKINDWVVKSTNGRIENIPLTENTCDETSLIVINAVYFKGEWKKPFHRTRMKKFYTTDGVKKIPMMIINDIFMYARTNILNAQIAAIPYKNGKTSFIVVLPYTKDGLPAVLRLIKQAPSILNSALKTLRRKELILGIPKFKMTSELDLKKLYEEVGVKKAMDLQDSGLRKIVENTTFYISKAIQKTVLEVTERRNDNGNPKAENNKPYDPNFDQVIFFADHPFLFYVTSNKEQLFAGIYNGVNK